MIKLPFITTVKGVSFYQNAVESVKLTDECLVVREKTNPFDSHACAVKVNNIKIGYIPKILAEQLVEHGDYFSGNIVEIVGQRGMRGVRVKIQNVSENIFSDASGNTSTDKEKENDFGNEDSNMKVFSKSGRFLGFLVGDRSVDLIKIKNAEGEVFSFPSELAVTSG